MLKSEYLSLNSLEEKAHPACRFSFWAQRLAVTEPEVPVLCAAVHLGFDTGQSDQSYANGNQMGREPPVDYRRRREACVFMYSCGDLGPHSFFSPFFPKSNKCEQKYLQFARILMPCYLADLRNNCRSVDITENWSNTGNDCFTIFCPVNCFSEKLKIWKWSLKTK